MNKYKKHFLPVFTLVLMLVIVFCVWRFPQMMFVVIGQLIFLTFGVLCAIGLYGLIYTFLNGK